MMGENNDDDDDDDDGDRVGLLTGLCLELLDRFWSLGSRYGW